MPDAINDFKLRPSDASRWMTCSGALQYQKQLGAIDESSDFANEGTEAHAIAEKLLRGESVTCSDEMRDYVMEYVTYVKNIGGYQVYEALVSFDEYVPGGQGTCDALVVKDNVLHVIDLKYGQGVSVSAYKNPQLMLYALGAYLSYNLTWEFDHINLTIHQPRMDNISEYKVSVQDLLAFAEDAREKAKLTYATNPTLTPGTSQCRFCACKPQCSALLKLTESTFNLKSSDTGIGTEDLKMVVSNKALITNWLNSVEADVTQRLLDKEKIDGLKLVQGAGRRKWYDEADAEFKLKTELGDDAYKKSLLSVAQAEKALGKTKKSLLTSLCFKGAGKPKVVLSDHPGKPYGVTADSFEVLEG